MCGIAGAVYPRSDISSGRMREIIEQMTNRLTHRGPDDSGLWIDENVGVSIGHRRLSIVDLSPAGHQPMVSSSARYVIVFNGEIYNFIEMRADLEKCGVGFRGHSDTEVLLEAIVLWGLETTLEKCNGMFAFGLWDRESRELILARDRVGKKPLFYGWCNGVFLFGSELKALKAHPRFDNEIDRGALAQFVQYNWLNGPNSIYANIKKLPAGTYARLSLGKTEGLLSIQYYWSAIRAAQTCVENPFSGSYQQAVERLDSCLQNAVSRRMIADVELGALLSGGIDSSLVVSLMQAQAQSRVKTFSIGFHEATHNEAGHAKAIAQYLGTDHTELYVSPKECLDVIPKLPEMYDEPLGDPSQIPTFLVSQLARSQVKVVLSGDGGDELFAGYTRYFRCLEHWKKHELIPVWLRPSIAQLMEVTGNVSWTLFGRSLVDGELRGWRRYGAKLEKRARRLDAKNPEELFVRMMMRYKNIEDLVLQCKQSNTILTDQNQWTQFKDPIMNMMLMDFRSYMADDILVKVDRASMATSLEVRCPLLDRDIVELAWSLPLNMKVENQKGKRILKSVLARYLPKELTERRKMGFGVPVAKWLRGPLKEWAGDFLTERTINSQAYFDSKKIQTLWLQHLSGWRNHSDLLWSVLMFQAWYEHVERNV